MEYKWSNLVIWIVIAFLFLGSPLAVATPMEKRLERLEATVNQLKRDLKKERARKEEAQPTEISHLRLPKQATLCGEKVPLSSPEVQRRIEFEFLLMLQDRAQVAIWMKRAQRVFPRMDKVFKEKKACGDLKYLALIESGLRSLALSSAKAKGYWQFIPGTAKSYDLSVSKQWDQRSDFKRSTEAGIRFLNELRNRFGSWPLAMAAYNTGPTRLQQEIQAQKVNTYWRLKLYREAERYVPRVIAAKLIMEHLEKYGFNEAVTPGWSRPSVDYVRVNLASNESLNLKGVADGGGLDYRALASLNPELMSGRLKGPISVVFEVTKGQASIFRAWAKKQTKKRAVVRSKSRKQKKKRIKRRSKNGRHYTVRVGDTLWDISQKFGMSVAELRRLNRLRKRAVIKVGDRLKVRRR